MNSRSLGRILAGASLAVVVVGTLSGCFEDFPEGRLSLSLESGQVLVANCGADVAGPFRLTIDESTEDFRNLFTASSDSSWKAGEVLSTSPDGWTEIKNSYQSKLDPGARIFVRYFSRGGEVAAVSKYAIPRRGLQEGKWLRFDGSVSSRACP